MKKLLSILMLLLTLVCVLAACEEARSITKSEIVNGELVITYNDSTSENLGKVVGNKGEKGDQGEKGEKGDTGATGAQGEKGEDLTDDNPQGLDFFLLPDGTYAVSAGKAAYLEDIVIPATYKGAAVTCIGLLPGLDDDAVMMGDAGAGFAMAPNLRSITIPASATSIGNRAFYNCTSLASVTFENKNGWKAGSTSISATNLEDLAKAATYLKSTYCYYTWTRTEE